MTNAQIAALCAAVILNGTLEHDSDVALFFGIVATAVIFGLAGVAIGEWAT